MIRPCAELYADFPDDQIEDEDGEITQFGGRGVAEAIAAILRLLGYDVSPPQHRQENGWDVEIMHQGKRVWMQVSDLGEVYILATEYKPKFRLFKKSDPTYPELLTRLNAELRADSRFHKVWWRLRNDVLAEAPGASEPVGV